ncbi:MAG TPA: translocation/assembly module TamB domain-containing protein, partial [Candidatus Eremiobacteraceae bacterium]|nr:translocation/assembly module TamB domain-containing protein [Candidatus Eremiobacteraceae bacterium]
AQLSGGTVRARAFFTADADELFLGPLLLQTQQGALTVAMRTDRSNHVGQPRRSLEAFVEHLPLQVSAGTFALPDIPSFAVTLPAASGTFDGVAFLGGGGASPAVAIAATANQLSLSGVTVQHVALRGAGANGFVNIAQIAAHGGSAEADAHGAALLDSNLRVRAAALQGTAAANLAMLAHAAPAARMSGSMQGRFFAMLDGSAWTVSAQARSSDARVGGIPIQAADATLGGKPAGDSSVLANMEVAGGQVSAVGSIANAQGVTPDSGTRVAALADHVDLTALKDFGVPLQRGSAVAIASVGGSLRRPDVRGAAAMTGSYRNTPVSGDVDVAYKDGILHSNASNVIVDNNLARLSGSVAGLANASPAKAALDLRVQVHEADLSAISQYAGSNSGLTGATNADVRILGSAAQPRISGSVLTDTGTLRGVPFDDLSGSIAASSGHVQLANGQVQLGTSRFHVSGQISPGVVALHATSPHVDMADFNDFFGGADMFAGSGAFRVNFASSNAGLSAAGGLRLDGAAVHDYELGHIETHFSSDQGALLATIAQNGPGGSAALSGRVAFRAYTHGLPDFASATYNVKANVRNLDVAEMTPIVHAEDLGLSGMVDAAGTLQGTLRRPVAFARVSLHDGHLRRITINNLSGLVQSDPSGVRVSGVQVATKFVTGDGQGRYEFGTRRVSAALNLDASDLAELTSVFQLPVAMRGPAHATIGLSGTTSKPLLQATLAGSHNTVAGFVFNDFKARFQYVPGELDIGDTQLGLASGGQIDVTGALPIQLQPLALGPKQRPVNLSLTASAVNLAEFNTLTGSNATLSGILNAQASVTGNAGNPSVAGVASVRAGGVVSRWETVPFTNVSADVSLLKDTITLRELRGQLGGGTLGINGAAHIVPAVGLRSNAGLQFYTNLNLRNANLDVPGWLSGTVNGDLSLTRTAVRPYLSGSIALNSATIPFSAIIALASGSATALASQTAQKNIPGVPTPAPGHSIAYAGRIFGSTGGLLTNLLPATPAPKKFSVPPIDLNVAVTAGKDVRVRGGSAIDLTADGAVVLGGSVESPSLAGSFRAVRGQVGYFDTTFRLERGT